MLLQPLDCPDKPWDWLIDSFDKKPRILNNLLIQKMSALPSRSTYLGEEEASYSPEFSYINLVLEEASREPKQSKRKLLSLLPNGPKSKEKHPSGRSKEPNACCRSLSRKKSKTIERSQSKGKKNQKKVGSRIATNSKKQYRTNQAVAKTTENKQKPRKSEKSSHKKIGLESVFKRHDPIKKKKPKEQTVTKPDKKFSSHKSKEASHRTLHKTKSDDALDRITLSEISKDHKLFKDSKVIHEYFGIEDKLSSIVQKQQQSKFRKQKDKSTTRSSASSVSQKKNKFKIRTGKGT